MGFFHNIRDSATSSPSASANGTPSPLPATVRYDPPLFSSTYNVKYLEKEILQQLLSIMMHEDKEVDISASL